MSRTPARSLRSRLLRSHLGMTLALVPALLILGAWLVWIPILHSATSDFATLIHDDVENLQSLPAEDRDAYGALMASEHGLYVLQTLPDSPRHMNFLPYLFYLQVALNHRFPQTSAITAINQPVAGYAFTLHTESGPIHLGFSHERIGTAPVLTLAAMAAITLFLATLGALLLARRLARPIETLRQSASELGRDPKSRVATNTGVRELDELAETLNTMQQQILRLHEQRSLLLAGVSHDLRTPLTRMGLALELARENPQTVRFERMSGYLEDMRQLIDSFISYSQINVRGGNEPCHPAEILQLLIQQRPNLAATLTQEIQSDPELHLNRLALTRILTNFLDNASKHGTPPFAVRQRPSTSKMGYNELRIEIDNGGPILTEEACQQAFEPFIRLDSARSPHQSGAGLGLAIVRDLANTQGWRAGLTPRAHGGVTAWLALPCTSNPDEHP